MEVTPSPQIETSTCTSFKLTPTSSSNSAIKMKIIDTWYSLIPVLVAFNFFEQDLTGLIENLDKYNTYLLLAYTCIALLEGNPLFKNGKPTEEVHKDKVESYDFYQQFCSG